MQAESFVLSAISLSGFSQGGRFTQELAARENAGLPAGLIGSGDGEESPCDDLYGFPPKQIDYPHSAAEHRSRPIRALTYRRHLFNRQD